MLKKWSFMVMLATLLAVMSVYVGTVQSQTAELPPLAEPGPHGVRLTIMDFVDASREDWTLKTYIWYPADKTQREPVTAGNLLLKDAPPDRSRAPYPLILFSHGWTGMATNMAEPLVYLASQGYVVAAPQHHDTDPLSHEFVDRPLDILTVLNELMGITDGDLAGMIDTNNVGLMGHSIGGTAVFEMEGLLSDPTHYKTWCAAHPDLATDECNYPPLQETAVYRAQLGLQTLPDGTWAPFGDERINAVLAIDPCAFPLTNDDSLAAVTTPVMILHGTKDEQCNYEGNAVRTYTQLGTEDRFLISLVNNRHLIIFNQLHVPQHFATAFFGRYLQGDETYVPYLTPEGLPTWPWPKLAWGPYEEE